MKILVITQYFYPENFRINQLCLDLKNRGNEITVLTGKPNYPKGEYYDGYSFKGNDNELWNNIPIIRVPLRARKKGSLNLLLNYISFIRNGNKKVKRIREDFDVIYVLGLSPNTVALPAIKLKKRKSIPIIMNIQDLWPESIVAVTGIKNRFIIGGIEKLVNYIYRNCDLLLCASSSFVNIIQDRLHSDKHKVKYWPQYSTVEKTDKAEPVFDKLNFNITFTGNIGEAQGIDLAIRAANELKDTNIHWNFIGEGRNKNRMIELVEELNLSDFVTFFDYMEEKTIPKYLAASDAALLILKPDPVFEMTIPAKLQTYLACGVPIIGCVNGEAKRIIENAKCGIVSGTVSIESLVSACREILRLSTEEYNNFKNNSYACGKEMFDKETLISQLEFEMRVLANKDSNQRSSMINP